ncbi:hypothetical protein [Campylobacter sp.]|uniref:hypothetical protein n=1 Tax=Campylobacter sp. TaxID=205 RepID=UPI002AA95AAF|nr:hypothetical protein [Campylobacter sp.]MCI6565071.1 hypothetical protein [Campylobacter sp.]MCI6579755.1 hypothetical protein [Campylobacter sp.]
MNDLMIVNSLQDLVKGAVPTQTAAPKELKLIIYNDDEITGFSGTVFKDPVSGEYTIAFRGTEKGNGKISA